MTGSATTAARQCDEVVVKRIQLAFLITMILFLFGCIALNSVASEKPCAECVSKTEVIALARERAMGQGINLEKVSIEARWNGEVWYVVFELDQTAFGSHFAYEYSRIGKFVRVHGGT